MPIVIVKKANAPVLPRADPLVVEPHCAFELIKPTRPCFEGKHEDWMLKLYRCSVCGEITKDKDHEVRPVTQCEAKRRREAEKEKRK